MNISVRRSTAPRYCPCSAPELQPCEDLLRVARSTRQGVEHLANYSILSNQGEPSIPTSLAKLERRKLELMSKDQTRVDEHAVADPVLDNGVELLSLPLAADTDGANVAFAECVLMGAEGSMLRRVFGRPIAAIRHRVGGSGVEVVDNPADGDALQIDRVAVEVLETDSREPLSNQVAYRTQDEPSSVA